MAQQINSNDDELRIINQLLCGLQRDLKKVWETIIRLEPTPSDALKLTFGVLQQLHDALGAMQAGNVFAIEHPEEFAAKMAELRSLNREKDKV